MVAEERVQNCPVTTCSYVNEERIEPYEGPHLPARWLPRSTSRTAPVTTCSYVCEEKVETIPMQTSGPHGRRDRAAASADLRPRASGGDLLPPGRQDDRPLQVARADLHVRPPWRPRRAWPLPLSWISARRHGQNVKITRRRHLSSRGEPPPSFAARVRRRPFSNRLNHRVLDRLPPRPRGRDEVEQADAEIARERDVLGLPDVEPFVAFRVQLRSCRSRRPEAGLSPCAWRR